ncbi:MAG TPA: hypothetical protein VK399_18245 [Longimicrobiaceae bacterium]|nr:hypothetical protein [Longimicrobiaceae bacterium]
MNQILEDVAADLLSSLIKTGARAGVSFIKSAISDQDTTPAAAPPRRAADVSLSDLFDEEFGHSPEAFEDEVEDPFAAPAACAEDFVSCLQRGDHDRACSWCEPGLFADGERLGVLLETLSAAQPRRWRCRLYHHPIDWQAGEPLPWVGVDYDVMFKLDSGARTMTLIVWIVAFENGWAVSGLHWGPMRAE